MVVIRWHAQASFHLLADAVEEVEDGHPDGPQLQGSLGSCLLNVGPARLLREEEMCSMWTYPTKTLLLGDPDLEISTCTLIWFARETMNLLEVVQLRCYKLIEEPPQLLLALGASPSQPAPAVLIWWVSPHLQSPQQGTLRAAHPTVALPARLCPMGRSSWSTGYPVGGFGEAPSER